MGTCGDFGGRRKDGEPCGRPRAEGPCEGHEPEEGPEEERTLCRHFGGRKKDGSPCNRRRSGGVCEGHDPESDTPEGAHTTAQLQRREAQERFLAALPGVACNISLACERAEIGRRSHYDWLEDDPTYRPRFLEAREQARDILRGRLHQRGVVGWDEVTEKTVTEESGETVRTRTERRTRRRVSDTILLRLAEAHLPEFRPRLDLRVLERELDGMSDEELLQEAERLLSVARGGVAQAQPE